jgi:hypothetical protein
VVGLYTGSGYLILIVAYFPDPFKVVVWIGEEYSAPSELLSYMISQVPSVA